MEQFHEDHLSASHKLSKTLAASLQLQKYPLKADVDYELLSEQDSNTTDTLQVQLVGGKAPTQGSTDAAGLDLYANEVTTLTSGRMRAVVYMSGVHGGVFRGKIDDSD